MQLFTIPSKRKAQNKLAILHKKNYTFVYESKYIKPSPSQFQQEKDLEKRL